MAQFELLKRIWAAFGDLVKPMGGRGTGGFYPEPSCYFEGPNHYDAGPLQLDTDGNLMGRTSVLTDEAAFRDDFEVLTAGINTVAFNSTSSDFVGTGTSFESALSNRYYVKRVADGFSAWTQVLDIVSDTEGELVEPYLGTTGTSAAEKTYWPDYYTGSPAGTVTAPGGILSIASGTTSGALTTVYRSVDYVPILYIGYARVATRIANQTSWLGLANSFTSPLTATNRALWRFSGTNNTQVTCEVSSGSGANYLETTTITIPGGLTTNDYLNYEISANQTSFKFSINGVLVAEFRNHIPGPYEYLWCTQGVYNSGVPASSSTLQVDTVLLKNDNRIEVAVSYRGEALPTQVREETHYHVGALTTTALTEQVLCSITVPAGRVFRLLGFSCSNNSTTIFAQPLRISTAATNTDPTAPGTSDGPVFHSQYMGTGRVYVSEDYSASPRFIAMGGQVVYMTVTPSGNASTMWRGNIHYVLR